ncbi:SRPBCC family protein [Oleiharenicola lentus]|uniref:SRPBCC family protein n=1 Tax=Oleiharenicola lentus TaxID=2508720 RepID=UPI003F6692F6
MSGTDSSFAEPQTTDASRDLVLTRVIDAPREKVFTAWTQHLPRWWGPHGITTPVCEMELRPGGIFRTVMRAPDGTDYPTSGVFLEIVPNQRIVFTDAFGPSWTTPEQPFMLGIISFEALPEERTRYTAIARHWSANDREKHTQMGFHQGWSESLDRLVAVVCTL